MKASKDQLKNLKTLKKRAYFLALNKQGQKWVSESLIVQAAPVDKSLEPSHIHFGITATKKLGKAVTRNRIRRRLRAAIADIFPDHAKADMMYCVIGRAETEHADAEKLRKDLKWCLKRLDCLRES